MSDLLLPVSDEVKVYGDEKRNQELLHALTRIESYLAEIAERPEPTVEAVDLAPLIASLPVSPSLDYDALASALTARLPADTSPQQVEVLKKLTDELRGIGKKVQALGSPVITGSSRTTIKNTSENPVPVEIVGDAAAGLTAGASLTWDAAYAVETVVAATGWKYGGPNDTTVNNAFGGLQFEIWEVPV